ncbi:PrsW family glutamic-type intramembrane protease [Oerskovia sp. KBS0722]|uniref:PrsW family glutamic-type intramembrane protease n=1 Tax=Oerskovia sp. KBS0722 TaxID=1179673 RepID=UPI00110D485A|nr:PrsW family glutamic-type intramembrane protease [Oerskovia sp. KBS0722]QDW61794.1 PrsW family intramembrane metalloprotease [Oerskovia sp. KBS0722]
MMLNILGAVLLIVGFYAAWRLAPRRPDAPAAGWFPDPASKSPRRRLWDGQAWTARVTDGAERANRGHHFRGRFWGRWVWILAAALVVLGIGIAAYQATENVHVMAVTSFLAMALVCWAFYGFVDRQLSLRDVIGLRQVAAVAVASAGATFLVALNLNDLTGAIGGISLATALVGFTEETAKLLVPIALFLLGTYRNPRAGVAIGLASGFGFAIAETTLYAYQMAAASGPAFCGGETPAVTTGSVIAAQVARIFGVSPFHWLFTGIAVAIAWRAWHLYGRKGMPAAIGGIVLVMVVHSLNDTSATLGCGEPTVQSLLAMLRYVLVIVMYLVFKAWTRKHTPPQMIGSVSKGWTPKHLGEQQVSGDEAPAQGDPAREPVDG